MRQPPSCAAPANQARYKRHCPEETTLYRVVQAHLDTFLAFADIETGGAGLPPFVIDEFDATGIGVTTGIGVRSKYCSVRFICTKLCVSSCWSEPWHEPKRCWGRAHV